MGGKRLKNKNYPQHLQEKKGSFYYVINIDGKTKWFPLETQELTIALQRWAECESKLAKTGVSFEKKIEEKVDDINKISLSKLITRYEKDVLPSLSVNTQYDYKRMLDNIKEKFGADTDIKAITRGQVIEYKDELKDTPYNANRTVNLMHVLFQNALDWGWIEGHNPLDKIKKFKEKRHNLQLTEKVLFSDIYPVADPMLKRAIMFAFHFSQHENEIKNLKWSDFDFEKYTVNIYRHKTDTPICINFSQNLTLISYINKIKKERANLCPYVICHQSKTGWHKYTSFKSMWLRVIIDKLELERGTYLFKEIRHLSNTLMKDGNITVDKRQAVTGHKSIQANEVYTHPTGNDTISSGSVLSKYGPSEF